MFERFTGRARQVIVLAQEESTAVGQDYIGTEHLLLGLLVEGDGAAARALGSLGVSLPELRRSVAAIGSCGKSRATWLDPAALATLGIDFDEVRRRVEESFGAGALEGTRAGRRICAGRPLLPRAKEALELSLLEARSLGDAFIGTEHLLFGLMRVEDGLAVEFLAEQGFSAEQVRAALLDELGRLAG